MELGCFASVRRTPNLIVSPEISLPKCFRTRILKSQFVELCRIARNIQVKSTSSTEVHNITNEIEVPGVSTAEREKFGFLDEIRREAGEILEWDLICEQVSRFASTSSGKHLCSSGGLPIGRDQNESQKLLDQTAAVVRLPRQLDLSGIDDVSEFVRLAVSREVLGVRELCAVGRSLRAARSVYEQLVEFSTDKESGHRCFPLLELFSNCSFMTEWVQKIESCIDSNLFVILDEATLKLASIRLERRKNMDNLESLLKNTSSRIFQAGGIDSPLITKRRSRMCVGIRASHKSLLPDGIVLGVSSSGATYFMEPRDVMELNNMEVRLANSEKAEEFIILRELTSEVAYSGREIISLMERIRDLDIACARGAHAVWTNGVRPVFSEDHEETKNNKGEELLMVDIEGICHPLLVDTSLKKLSFTPPIQSEMDGSVESWSLAKNEKVVPLDIKIKHTTKVVVISGPNTGGKTATMKTLGLASLMSKAGMFLPATNHPRLPWFDQVLADIGDHQSLEHNLSTFSGHISRLCKILDAASRKSLVLIDEIGNGTDPSEGMAISVSILQHLVGRVSLAVVTTHYADLSLLKAKDSRFENAAMEFCIETLKPTYRILWGSTGKSNAISIAKSIGFDQEVLYNAQLWVEKLLPDKQKERQGMLYMSLKEERNKLEAQARKAESILLEAKKLYLEIHSEAEDLARREAALKSMETQKVHDELKAVKSQMDVVVKNFESQLKSADPNQFNALMRQEEASIASIVEAQRLNDEDLALEESGSNVSYAPQIGDQVRVKRLGDKLATIVEVLGDNGDAVVQYGKIRVRAKKNDMKFVTMSTGNTNNASRIKGQVRRQGFRRSTTDKVNSSNEEVSFGAAVQTSKNTVDLRGMRVEEASNCLNLAISGCRPYGVLFVVHGIGTGAIKECTLGVLRKHPRVAKLEEESPINYGCTIVYVK